MYTSLFTDSQLLLVHRLVVPTKVPPIQLNSLRKYPNFVSLSSAILLLHAHTHPPLKQHVPVFLLFRPAFSASKGSCRNSRWNTGEVDNTQHRAVSLRQRGLPVILVHVYDWPNCKCPKLGSKVMLVCLQALGNIPVHSESYWTAVPRCLLSKM